MAEIKKDFIDVTKPTATQQAILKIRELEAEYTKKHLPYDRKGAINALEDYLSTYEVKLARSIRDGRDPEPFTLDIDWNKFGDPKNFTIVGESDAIVQNARTGHVAPTLLGTNRTFLAKSGSKRD